MIVSAGAINSPQLLQLSGVGPGDLLQRFGIDVVADLINVGRNLQDHLSCNLIYRTRVATLNSQLRPWWGRLRHGTRYLLTRRGPLSIGVNQAGGFIRTNDRVPRPNAQLYFQPTSYTRAPPGKRPLMSPDRFQGFQISVQPTRPTSAGELHLSSPDPMVHPEIAPLYLSTEKDIEEMLEGVQFVRKLARAPSLDAIIETELLPGNPAADEDLLERVRQQSDTVFHPVSTCRMGADAATSVVDPRLRVHGLQGLRVVDASVFPTLVSGNTNAPTMMVAEKAADIILSDWRS